MHSEMSGWPSEIGLTPTDRKIKLYWSFKLQGQYFVPRVRAWNPHRRGAVHFQA